MGGIVTVVYDGESGAAVTFQSAHAALERALVMREETGAPIGAALGESSADVAAEARALAQQAAPGQVLVSSLVASVVGSRRNFTFAATEAGDALELHPAELQAARRPLPRALLEGDVAMVGRQSELDRLLAEWRRARGRERRTVMLVGEPGIGKTRLAGEMARLVHDEGGQVLYGRSDEDLGVPYQPFIEALAPFSADLVDPRLARLFPRRDASSSPGGATDRYLLFEAVTDALARVCARAPTLLVLDDLHWAAVPTLRLLGHVLQSSAEIPVLIVGTYRDTEIGVPGAVATTLVELGERDDVAIVSLSGIEREPLRELLTPLMPADATTDTRGLADVLHAATGGNPFFLLEVVAGLEQSGTGWDAVAVPDGVTEMIENRVSRLAKAAQEILRTASVAGPTFSMSMLEALDLTDVDVALDDAARAGLIARAGAEYSFRHALIRETLYGGLSGARRCRIHRQIGEALEHEGDPSQLAALAHHFLNAAETGVEDKAVDYAIRTADAAMEVLAYERAVAVLTDTLVVIERAGAISPERQADVYLALAEAHAGASEFHTSRRAARTAASLARDAQSPTHLARAAVLYSEWGNLALGLPDPAAAALCEEALDALPPDAIDRRVRVLAHLALYRFWSEGAREAARELAEDALRMARQVGDPYLLSLALHAMATSLDGSEQVDRRLALVLEQGRLPNHDILEADNLYSEGIARIELGDRAGVEEVIARLDLLPTAQQGWWRPRCWAIVFRAVLALMDGRLAEVEPLANQAVELWNSPDGLNTYGALLMMLRREEGRTEELLSMAEVVGRAEAFRPALAWLYAEAGERDRAAAVLAELATDDFASLSRGAMWAGSLCMAASAAVAAEDPAAARWLYEQLQPHAGHLVMTGHGGFCVGSADAALGALAALLGDATAAADHYRAALVVEEGMGAAALAARSRAGLRQVLAD